VFPLGHIGIGTLIVPARIHARFSWAWFAFGCVLPDVIDKPVFLAAKVAARTAPETLDVLLDALSGSRLFGHSLLFFSLLVASTAIARPTWLQAIVWGVATHLLLDLGADLVSGSRLQWPTWLLWPFFGWGFPADASRIAVKGINFERTLYRAGEVVGATLIVLEFVRRRRA
jgi:membrane-bound metal-dependent hydrolase YbcI (DUF457 family)